MTAREWSGLEIAVVGMAGRFPGAADIPAFWRLLCEAREGLRRLDPAELIAAGREPALVHAPEFVPVHGVLDGFDHFDAEFFGYRPSEAEGIDPQQRLFLEVAWHALEDAGCDPSRFAGTVGVFAGSSSDHYLYEQLLRNPQALARIGSFQANYSNQPDHLAARVAYKLGLTGAAIAVQTACSTSLVAVHLACQQLLAGGCDLALAGGVSITLPRFWGYRHEEGMILSPDGHCRAFDARAAGTLKGDGLGVVVLKRLADALADGDRIDAVILASAVNNDGQAKVGYTAPGLDGQARLVAQVLAAADVAADSIGYIEAHGTATPLGDPIEIAALTRAFGRGTARTGFCGIGSVKTNIGHLDAAAGVAGLIKATLALRHATLPASLHFETPNPQLGLPSTPFSVVDRTRPWAAGGSPRRAGVSSFGIGGTNAHVLLEEPPAAGQRAAPGGPHLLLLSAQDAQALDELAARLADRLDPAQPGAEPVPRLDDVAHTLASGRRWLVERRAVVARDAGEAAAALRRPAAGARHAAAARPAVVFLFPGQGAQYVGMARGLYDGEPRFRAEVDRCCDLLQPLLGTDLRTLLWPAPGAEAAAADALRQTAITQPALFVVEYALAQLLMAGGVQPAAMVGHSVGEIVAACLGGVFELPDALRLVAERGRLMQAQPPGAMLSVPMAPAALAPWLDDSLDVAAHNAPQQCVVAGPLPAIEALQQRLLAGPGVEGTLLQTSHAFHSRMMEPAVAPFVQAVQHTARRAPALRIASTVSGGWSDAGTDLTDPAHWAANLRGTVRFAEALERVFTLGDVVLLEVGPGSTLSGLARQHPGRPPTLAAAGCVRHPKDTADDRSHFLGAIGRLWCSGVAQAEAWVPAARKVALPGYPFRGRRFWVDPEPPAAPVHDAAGAGLSAPVTYTPAWVRSEVPPAALPAAPLRWRLAGPAAHTAPLAAALGPQAEVEVIDIGAAADWPRAWQGPAPDHLLLCAAGAEPGLPELLRAIAADPPAGPLRVTLVTAGTARVLGDETIAPDHVLPIGWLQVLPTEVSGLGTRVIDRPAAGAHGIPLPPDAAEARQIVREACAADDASWVAYRHGRRWKRSVAALSLPPAAAGLQPPWRERGVYLVSGGLGGMGLVLAGELARRAHARLVLFGRRAVAPRDRWDARIADTATPAPERELLAQLLALEAQGAEVMAAQADVTDAAAMAALVAEVRRRFGAVNGLIHAAGIPGGSLAALQDAAAVEQVLAPKVQGLRVLREALRGEALDLVVLCSSLTSFVPLRGRADYTAANLWLDASAQAAAGDGARWLSINWDNWAEIGMARLAARDGSLVGLTNDEGADALMAAVAGGEPQVLVAKRDLLASRVPAAAGPAPADAAAPPPAATAPVGDTGEAGAVSVQEQLLGFVRDLLGMPGAGADDDFFALGGDSVVSLQLVARARRAGLRLAAKQVFELRTVAAMAAACASSPGAVAPVAAAVVPGDIAASPIQRWFLELPLKEPGHWNLGAEAAVAPGVDAAALRQALAAAVATHDAFALRVQAGADGTPRLTIAPDAGLDFDVVEADTSDPAVRARLAARAQAPFDLARGPLVRAIWATGGDSARLFLGAHHLAADITSLQILLDDAQALLARRPGQPAPAPGTSWRAWVGLLTAQASSAAAGREHWLRLAEEPWAPLPGGPADANTVASAATQTLVLDARTSAALLAAHGPGARLAAALLAAVARAVCGWSTQPRCWIDVESHGREPLGDDIDLSRTVGWFTATQPLALAADAGAAAVHRQLENAPLRGLGWGLLRHLGEPGVRAALARLPRPEIVFLHQGQRGAGGGGEPPPLQLLAVDAAHGRAPQDRRSHAFELLAWVEDGRVHLDWTHSHALHDAATVRALLAGVESALQQEAAPAAPDARLSFAQERLWFLQQLDPGATVFNKIAVLALDGPLDADALDLALTDLATRHDALRTRFVRDAEGQPRLDRLPQALWTAERIDVPGGSEEAAEAIAQGMARRPFDLAAAPPRVAALLRLAPERHWLLLCLHHIVTDAWSIQVVLDDLATLYGARRRAEPDPLPAAPPSFAAYAQRQRDALQPAALAPLLAFWTGRLAGLSPLELPTDRPRPAVQGFQGERLALRWPAALTSALRERARAAGASPFMALLAVFKLLLHRWSGQDDIVVGVPAADRPLVETERLVGPLVNNLVLRTDLSGAPGVDELLARVRDTVLAANEHRDLPFEKLVEALNPPRDRSRSPLFSVMFMYMNVPPAAARWDGLQAAVHELHTGGAEVDLALYAYAPAPGEGLVGWIEYNVALFDRATMQRLAGHLERLAAALCEAAAGRPAAALPMLTDAEFEQLVRVHNRTEAAHPPFATLAALVAAQVQRTPHAVALQADDATLDYRALADAAGVLALRLQALGVGADDRVAVCLDRSSALPVALLAVLAAGAAYVPVDPAFPAMRVAHMLQDSGARVVLTQRRLLATLPATPATVLCIDEPDDGTAAPEGAFGAALAASGAGSSNLAYVIYTSGSTGLPKGVQITHGAVVNFLQAMAREPGMGPADRLLAITTVSFDIHVLELFLPLAVGARVVLAAHATAADGTRLRAVLESGDITAMQATPATWRMLIDAGWQGTPGLALLCGGEALAPDLARALRPRGRVLWNLYGPTEATVWATIARIDDPEAPITVGRPFDNMRAYVLGPHDQPQPTGVPGELCLGGAGVARGYLGRPALTAERFVDDPFVAGARIYRTGDQARWRADGTIEVLGRLDHQVKLRGHRIELGEIEAVCLRMPEVAQCVCLVREDRPGDQRLVAYAVGRDGRSGDFAALRRFAAEHLPAYMLPAAVVWLPAFPLTPNGKVDRRALPAPEPAAAAPAPAQAMTAAERFFADHFADVLGVAAVGPMDNFFDLGGHSLLVMKLVDRIERAAGLRLQPGELFQQTVGQLAAFHATRLAATAVPAAPTAAPAVGAAALQPCFFEGANGSSLYGVHHGAAGGLAVLVCAPLPPEYIRCHRALRQLASRLAQRGCHVLRFDYRGSGDSSGDAAELHPAACIDDIHSALAELRRRAPGRPVAVVGLRHGATLAAAALARHDGPGDAVEALVLWQPVSAGSAVLDDWRAAQRSFESALGYGGAGDEVLGQPLPPELAQAVSALALEAGARSRAALLIDGSDPRQPTDAFVAAAAGRAGWLTHRRMPHDAPWQDGDLDRPTPAEPLLAIVDWLAPGGPP